MAKQGNNGSKGAFDEGRPTLSSYEPVHVVVPSLLITDAEVEGEIEKVRKGLPVYRKAEPRKIKPDDSLLIKADTVEGDEPVGNLTYDSQRVSMDDPFMPAGLKAQLLSMEVGETRTFDYAAPDLGKDEKGNPKTKDVTSTVTVLEIQEKAEPDLTDEWVARNIPGANTVDEFRKKVRKQMQDKAGFYTEDTKYSLCAAELATRLEGRIPDDVFEQGIRGVKKQFEDMLKQEHMTKEEYLKKQGISEDQLNIQFMMQGREMIAEGRALEAMGDYLGLKVEDADIYAVFGKGATLAQAKNMRKKYEEAGRGEELKHMAYCGKALEYVVKNAQVEYRLPSDIPNPFNPGSAQSSK